MSDETEESGQITYSLKAVEAMLNMTGRRIKTFEQTTGNIPARMQRGAISVRAYSPEDVFNIADNKRKTGDAVKLARPVTCTVFLPKGGCGKSTLSTELAVQWQLRGLKVLIIDLDPQASSSFILGLDPEASAETAEAYGFRPDEIIHHTFASLHDFKEISGSEASIAFDQVVKKPYGENGPHLIPADVSLSALSYKLYQANNRDQKLAAWINRGRRRPDAHLDLTPYDVIIFDSAPATSVVSRASLVAADFCIAPIRLDALSAKSMSFIASELQGLVESELPCPEIIAVPTFFSLNNQRSSVIMQGLWANYPDNLVQSRLRSSEIFPRALMTATPRERMPVSLRNPMHPVVREDMANIADEILAKIQASTQSEGVAS